MKNEIEFLKIQYFPLFWVNFDTVAYNCFWKILEFFLSLKIEKKIAKKLDKFFPKEPKNIFKKITKNLMLLWLHRPPTQPPIKAFLLAKFHQKKPDSKKKNF